MLEVEGDRPLVGVEQQEIVGVEAGNVGRSEPTLFTPAGRLNLDHVRAEPGQRLSAGSAGFELREIEHPDASQRRSCVRHRITLSTNGDGDLASAIA